MNALTGDLPDLIQSCRSGMTLPAPLYLAPDSFDYEMRNVLHNNWWFARLSSELRAPGSYALLQIAISSIILVRGRDGIVRGFYNSCRHRGATLCREQSGSFSRITCPYHSWTFGLDGALLSAPHMPEGFDRGEYGLHQVHVREELGMIFVNLAEGAAPDFDVIMAPHRDYLKFHGIASAKAIARKTYVVEANWKLAIENLLECYHCLPSHPSLCVVEGRDELVAYGMDPESGYAAGALRKIEPRLAELRQKQEKNTFPAADAGGVHDETGTFATQRYPLAAGMNTGTMDGKCRAPAMGQSISAIGTGARLVFTTSTYMQVYPDHAVCLSYLPQTHDRTIVEQVWLTDAHAELDDAQIEAITELWDKTTREDGWLAENQVSGVRQPAYQPGPLSSMESGVKGFLDWYLFRMRRALGINSQDELAA